MQDDVTDATHWTIDNRIADPAQICAYGAYASLMATVVEPELYQRAVGLAGIYDLTLLDRTGDVKDAVPAKPICRLSSVTILRYLVLVPKLSS